MLKDGAEGAPGLRSVGGGLGLDIWVTGCVCGDDGLKDTGEGWVCGERLRLVLGRDSGRVADHQRQVRWRCGEECEVFDRAVCSVAKVVLRVV